jgi:hypothetical protein
LFETVGIEEYCCEFEDAPGALFRRELIEAKKKTRRPRFSGPPVIQKRIFSRLAVKNRTLVFAAITARRTGN